MLVASFCVDLKMFSEVHVVEGSGVKVVSSAKAVRKLGGVTKACVCANHIHMTSLLLNLESCIIKGTKKQKWLCDYNIADASTVKHHFGEVDG